MSEPIELKIEEKGAKPRRTGIYVAGLLAVLTAFYAYSIPPEKLAQSHAVAVQAPVSGTVRSIEVAERQQINAGDILIVLDDTAERKAVEEAEAELAAAKTAAEDGVLQATVGELIGFPQIRLSGNASDLGPIRAPRVEKQEKASMSTSKAMEGSSKAETRDAEKALSAKTANQKKLADAFKTAESQLASSESEVAPVEANLWNLQTPLKDAEAAATKAKHLFEDGVMSRLEWEAKEAVADHARASVAVADEQVKTARALVERRKSELAEARVRLEKANGEVVQAQAALTALAKTAEAQKTEMVKPEVSPQSSVLPKVLRGRSQALARIHKGPLAPLKVDVVKADENAAKARVHEAELSLQKAQAALEQTRIRAPFAGIVVQRAATTGQSVIPGQSLLTILRN